MERVHPANSEVKKVVSTSLTFSVVMRSIIFISSARRFKRLCQVCADAL
jgi:hypothetical protein